MDGVYVQCLPDRITLISNFNNNNYDDDGAG